MTDEPGGSGFRARRRDALAALGGAGAWLLAGRSFAQASAGRPVPPCVLTPAQTEGPYFVDERLERSDIRGDPSGGAARTGALLALELGIASVTGSACAPVQGAIVDIWHCDAAGLYSDVDDMSFRTKGSRFLRGFQKTDANGIVRFTTIYPGAYPGRAVHVHFKVRRNGQEFTSQLYFDDAFTDRVHAAPPYAGAQRRTRNAADGLYRHGGRELQLVVANAGDGYVARYDIGLRTA